MSKKEEFKTFANSHPELISSIRNGETTWQNLYEIYDIYGEDETAWNKYLRNDNTNSSFTNLIKNIDMESIQNHINTAQKALSFISELTSKGTNNISEVVKGPENPRPLNKFFGD